MKFLAWNEDEWLSKHGSVLPYDKLEHFILAFAGCQFLPVIVVAVVSIAWEIKDGLLPYDDVHIQGFSWKDLIADFAGIALAMLI
jgi:hypothetical protein